MSAECGVRSAEFVRVFGELLDEARLTLSSLRDSGSDLGELEALIERAERLVKAHGDDAAVKWVPIAQPPDEDLTVMVCNPDWDEPVWMGFLDVGVWRSVDASECYPAPTHWAMLPAACAGPLGERA
jgi:hypothetical protein